MTPNKSLEKIKNVLSPSKAKEIAKKAYDDYMKSPLNKVYTSIKNSVKQIGNLKTPFGYQVATPAGTIKIQKTVSEAAQDLKQSVVQMAKKLDGAIGGKGTGQVKKLDNVPRIDEIEVNFNYKTKFDLEEFAKQLKDQENGMNELTVYEYQQNRKRFIDEGRAIESKAAQQAARKKALSKKIEELFESGMSWDEAEKKAESWLETQAALHNPDQVAGGNPLDIGGLGDKRVNFSIGAQWKYRIDIVDEKIEAMAKNMTPEQRKSTYLNVKLTH